VRILPRALQLRHSLTETPGIEKVVTELKPELEIGWIPLLLTQSGNPRIQLGSPGYFEASQYVVKLEIPKVLDRALGDLHPGGNPHVHTDPRNIAKIALALEDRMVQIDPANAESYRTRAKSFLGRWQAGDTDILVGTQMVSKGHDVPGVTLVAVLLADLALNVPDFRAAERTFQLLVQVAGRAGRGDAPGRVIVQTFRPDHPSIAAAATHDYKGFMARELERRRALGNPPFSRLVNLRLDGPDGGGVERAAHDLGARLRREAARLGLGADAVLGPAPPPVEPPGVRPRSQGLLVRP